jgi:hypothetical protein
MLAENCKTELLYSLLKLFLLSCTFQLFHTLRIVRNHDDISCKHEHHCKAAKRFGDVATMVLIFEKYSVQLLRGMQNISTGGRRGFPQSFESIIR